MVRSEALMVAVVLSAIKVVSLLCTWLPTLAVTTLVPAKVWVKVALVRPSPSLMPFTVVIAAPLPEVKITV